MFALGAKLVKDTFIKVTKLWHTFKVWMLWLNVPWKVSFQLG